MIYELRTYELFNHNKKAVHDRFAQHTVRIMEKYGFKPVGFWEVEIGNAPELTYLLAWDDLNQRQTAWDAFNIDGEWLAIKAETNKTHGPVVAKNRSQILKPTAYSPLQ